MKVLTMSYAKAISFFTMGLTDDPIKFGDAAESFGGGQDEFIEAVLPLAVGLESVYDAIPEHHDYCEVVWTYEVVQPFGQWVADFMANPGSCGCVPGKEAIDYLVPILIKAFKVENNIEGFKNGIAETFRKNVGDI